MTTQSCIEYDSYTPSVIVLSLCNALVFTTKIIWKAPLNTHLIGLLFYVSNLMPSFSWVQTISSQKYDSLKSQSTEILAYS